MIQGYAGSYYGNFRTRTFNNIFPNVATFKAWLNNGMFPIDNSVFGDDKKNILYYALVAQYGNSHIANSDETQFKVNISLITFKYGLAWSKKYDIQRELQLLSVSQMRDGATQIQNNANNPGEIPVSSSTVIDSDGKFTYINQQAVGTYKKGLLEAYGQMQEILKTDVTSAFINKYRDLFINFVMPELPLLYQTEEDED